MARTYKSAYTGAQIDDAVAKRHTHANKTLLDSITTLATTLIGSSAVISNNAVPTTHAVNEVMNTKQKQLSFTETDGNIVISEVSE